MNYQVRYYSKTNNTKRLAECIAETLGVEAKSIESGKNEEADILFLGASVYAYGIDKSMKKYITELDPNKVKEVVVFSTSALVERAFPDIKKRLNKQGIKVNDDNFYCRGEFKHMHKGRPNEQDLKDAKAFAEKFVK